ncbi:PQQ-binding-like beta-propeller repeat protein [Micromonospora sp. NPDC048909]|uniref:outer membrane protein assembly factor BamB family protein n=1 Tax=Micromonospora sp. NPDC048909 TaxID=3155643 RepID=UPI0033FE5148
MAVIDLGELRDGPATDAPERRLPPVGRPLRIVLVLLLVLATVAGAESVAGRVSAVVPGSPTAEAFLAGDQLLISQPIQGVTDRNRELLAYPLPDRATREAQRPAPLWRIPVPFTGELGRVQAGSGALLLYVGGQDGEPETIALDAQTGQVRWRQPGFGWLDAAGRVFLETPPGPASATVQMVDVRSGRPFWSAPSTPPGSQFRIRNGVIDRVVLVRPGSEVEVRDAATGDLLRRTDLGLPVSPEEQPIQVIGDLLLSGRDQGARPAPGDRRPSLAGYDLDRLEQRWAVELATTSYLMDCGEVLCAYLRAGGIQALDPATGTLRWSSTEWAFVLAAEADRLLVLREQEISGRFAVLDAGTGRLVADLGTWQLASSNDPDAPMLGIRLVGDGRLVVAELDVTAGRAQLLDVLTGAAGNCQAGPGTLVCRRLDGSFGAWRWRE